MSVGELDDVADGERQALLGRPDAPYEDPANADLYTENNVNQAIYSVAGKYLRRLYRNGVLGHVLTGNNATINTDKAKEEYNLAKEVLSEFRDALEMMASRCTDAALRSIQEVMDKIDRSIEYYRQLSEGKDVWRTNDQSRYRLTDALKGLSELAPRNSRLAMAERAVSVAGSLHTPVRLIMDTSELAEEERDAMGWYDTKTGEVVIVVPNHSSVSEIEASVLHEVLGHKSMNEMLGEEGFNQFLQDIYNHCDEETSKRIARKVVDGMDLREATEEAVAEIAEEIARGRKPSTWEQLRSALKQALRTALRKLGFEANFDVDENDILYALWKNKKKLERGDVMGAAKDMEIQRGLDVDHMDKRFRRTSAAPAPHSAQQIYERALKAHSYRFTEAYQDSMLSLKRLQEAVANETKTPVKEFEDAYTMENQLSSRNTAEIEMYMRDCFDPMVRSVKEFMKKAHCNYDGMKRYLFAKSGIERNREFAVRDALRKVEGDDNTTPDLEDAINDYYLEKAAWEDKLDNGDVDFDQFVAEMQERAKNLIAMTFLDKNGMPKQDIHGNPIDGYREATNMLEKDYSGLSALFDPDDYLNEAMVTVDTEEAVAGKEMADKLWYDIRHATSQTLDKNKQTGLISVDTHRRVSNMMHWYIPMRGWQDTTAEEVYDYYNTSSGFSPTLKDAKGRTSIADDPIATIGNMAESAIMAGNRNKMKEALYNLALNHPTKLLKVMKAWVVNNGTEADPKWEYAFPDIEETDTPEEVQQKMEDFEDMMRQKQEEGTAKHEINRLDIPYVTLPKQVPEHIVTMKRNGRRFMMVVNGNPRAAQAVNGFPTDRKSNSFQNIIGKVNRFMAGAFTTKNPTFIARNLSRDLIFANSAVIAKENKAYGNRFRKNQFVVMANIASLLSAYKKRRLTDKTEIERYFGEFIKNGGETGFTVLHSVNEFKRRMAGALKDRNKFVKAGKDAIEGVFDCIEFGNRCAEDVSRFTVYMTSRQMGRSVRQSIADAKEITVNFNKKGAGATAGGLTGASAEFVRSLFLFSNAAIQGMVNAGRMLKSHPVKTSAVISSFMAMGVMAPLINQLLVGALGSGDGDDDPYNNLPDFVRHSNLCFYIGNWGGSSNFFTVPLSIELRAFYGLGEMLTQWSQGNITGDEAGLEFATSICELAPINFMGSAGLADSFTPDFAKPIEQVYNNTDFTGKPIYKKSEYNKLDPEWTKAYSGTSKGLINACKALNVMTGGDNVKKGGVDLNPAAIEHIITGYTGGLGQTFIDVAKICQMGVNPEYRDVRNVPIAKAFVRQSDERTGYATVKRLYEKNRKWYEEMQHMKSGYTKEAKKGALEYADYLRQEFDQKSAAKFGIMKAWGKELGKVYKALKETDDDDVKARLNALVLEMKRRCVEQIKQVDQGTFQQPEE
jgi:hypothetical protein